MRTGDVVSAIRLQVMDCQNDVRGTGIMGGVKAGKNEFTTAPLAFRASIGRLASQHQRKTRLQQANYNPTILKQKL